MLNVGLHCGLHPHAHRGKTLININTSNKLIPHRAPLHSMPHYTIKNNCRNEPQPLTSVPARGSDGKFEDSWNFLLKICQVMIRTANVYVLCFKHFTVGLENGMICVMHLFTTMFLLNDDATCNSTPQNKIDNKYRIEKKLFKFSLLRIE